MTEQTTALAGARLVGVEIFEPSPHGAPYHREHGSYLIVINTERHAIAIAGCHDMGPDFLKPSQTGQIDTNSTCDGIDCEV